MLRYIKVNNKWIDTLKAQKEGLTYLYIEGAIIVVDEDGIETEIGQLQGESDDEMLLL